MGVIARQSIKGALANYLGVAIGFVSTFFVVTRMLTQAEVGLTRMLVDGAVLFSNLAALGTSSSVVKFFPHFRTDDGRHHGAFGLSLLVPAIGFALMGLIFLLFRAPLTEVFAARAPLLAGYMHLMPMLAFFMLYMLVFETDCSVLMRITVPKLTREVGVRLINLVAYLLYGFGMVGIDTFVWLFCGSYGVAMAIDAVYLLRLTGGDWRVFHLERGYVSRQLARDMLRYTLLITASILAASMPLLSSLFLGAKVGAATAGVYAIASYMANVVEVPYRSLGAITRPVIATAVKMGDWGEVNRLGRQVSLHQQIVSLVILYLIWINLDTLFTLLPGGEDYRSGAIVVLLLGLAKVVNSTLSIAIDVLGYSRHYAWGLLFVGVMTVGTIVLTDWMIDLWGIGGSAAAVLSVYVVYYVPLLWLLWRKVGFAPFSVAQAKMVAIAIVAFGVDWLWLTLWPEVPSSTVAMIALAVLKSVLLGGAMMAAVLAWHLSPTVDRMARELPARLLKGKQR